MTSRFYSNFFGKNLYDIYKIIFLYLCRYLYFEPPKTYSLGILEVKSSNPVLDILALCIISILFDTLI